jgi:hypothetical protein
MIPGPVELRRVKVEAIVEADPVSLATAVNDFIANLSISALPRTDVLLQMDYRTDGTVWTCFITYVPAD